MRLSEMMMLGDSLRSRRWSVFLDNRTNPPCGCALGGATLAMGSTDVFGHRELWPWVTESCTKSHFRDWTYEDEIGVGDKGFSAVMAGKLTFEQFIDYVRSIEPSCGECCQFSCTCVQTMESEPAVTLQPVYA